MLTAFPRGGTLETYKRNIFIHLCSIFDRKLGSFGVQKYRSVLHCRALHTKALISLSRFHTTSLTIKRPDDPHANFPVALDLPSTTQQISIPPHHRSSELGRPVAHVLAWPREPRTAGSIFPTQFWDPRRLDPMNCRHQPALPTFPPDSEFACPRIDPFAPTLPSRVKPTSSDRHVPRAMIHLPSTCLRRGNAVAACLVEIPIAKPTPMDMCPEPPSHTTLRSKRSDISTRCLNSSAILLTLILQLIQFSGLAV